MIAVAPLGPGVRRVIGDDDLREVATDGGVSVLRPSSPGRDLLVLHGAGSAASEVVREAEQLGRLDGRGPAPEVLASGRSDEGDEALVLRLPATATPLAGGHATDPLRLVTAVSGALRELHASSPGPEACDVGPTSLRETIVARVARGRIAEAPAGPYAGRSPEDLSGLLDRLLERVDPSDPVVVHGGLSPSRIWVDVDGGIHFTGWRGSGAGDRHLDIAAAAVAVAEVFGSALVPPLLEAYGPAEVDSAALDAFQLLVHLLR